MGSHFFLCGERLRAKIFGRVSFTFSPRPRSLGAFFMGVLFLVVVLWFSCCLVCVPRYLGLLQLLHVLLTSKRTSDRQG